MTEDHDSGTAVDVSISDVDDLEELEGVVPQKPIETAVSIATGPRLREAIPLVGGGVVLLSAIRSLARGEKRAIPAGIVGTGLVGLGLQRRRKGEDEGTTEMDTLEIEEGTEGKDVSDAAHAAVDSEGDAEQPREDPVEDSDTDRSDEDEDLEFTHGDRDAERSEPGLDADVEDPRRDIDDDETTEIDVSKSALADEPGEAAGPDPEQAQPAQTDVTEPEDTPEEDASDMKVEPGEESDSVSDDEETADETDAEGDEDDETGSRFGSP